MGLGSFIWYGGSAGVFKALLRTGSNFDPASPNRIQFFVGGDRPVPFGPLPIPSTGPRCYPVAITAIGPGLNDWVVAYATLGLNFANTGGTNIAFANHLGLFREIELALPPSDGNFLSVSTLSLGVIMSHRSGFTFEPTVRTERWITSSSGVGGSAAVSGNDGLAYRLPGLLVPTLTNSVTPDHTLSYAFSLQADSQSLYFADLSSVNLTPSIPDLTINTGAITLTDDLRLLHISSTFNNDLFLTARDGGNLAVSARQWQLYTDGTWQALSNISGTFQGGAGGYLLQPTDTDQVFNYYPAN